MKKLIQSLLIIILVVEHASAADPTSLQILLPSLQIPNEQFQAYMETSEKNQIGFSDFYLKNRPLFENTSELLNLFEKAQILYFSQSTDQAQELYGKILLMTEMDEWSDIHRKIFYTAYLRMAELMPSQESAYLTKAILFAPEMNLNDIEASTPLKEKIKKLTTKRKTFDWNISGFKKDFKVIVINGHVLDLKKTNKVIIPAGKFRITFLSDYYKPQTFNVTAGQVPFIEPIKIAFVNGTCEKSRVSNDGELTIPYEVYFGSTCEKIKTTQENYMPTYEKLPSEILTTSVERPLYKKPLFWVAVTAVVAGTVIYVAQKNKREGSSEETSREVIP